MSFTIRAEGGARAADRDEIRRALSALADPAGWVEVFSLPSGRSARREGGDLAGLVEAAHDLSDGSGTYYRINPVGPGGKAANNGDVVSRRHLLVDCDPVRPDGVMATDIEKSAGIEQARAAAEFLSSHGWPDPAWVDSGSGVQLLYRIDLANDALARQWLKAILARLGDETDTDASKIDRGVFRANQLGKLPGTWARKGADLPDRPHRPVRLVSLPATIEAVTTEQLGAMAGMAVGGTTDTQPKGGRPSPPPSATAPSNGHANGHAPNPWGVKATARGLDGYVRSAIHRECAVLGMTPLGGRNDALNAAAFSLGTMAGWPEMDATDAKLALYTTAKQAGLTEDEIRKTLASGWDSGAAKGRQRPVEPAKGKATNANAKKPHDPNKRLITWASEVTPRKVDWLWPGRIPVGKATTFAGQTGMGKTFAVCDIAARISRGAEIPCCGGECFRQGKVLIISAEDDADDTIVPRLIDLGADLSQIAFLSPAAEAEFSLAALELLNNSLDQMAGDVRMVAIDPPTSYLGRVDDHKNAELRGLLAPLRRWTIERQVALVMITHINKGAANVDAMARVMGSAAWVQAVRAAHMFVGDPDAKGKSLFLPLKVNNAKKPPGIGYEIIEQADGRVTLNWLGEVDTSPEDALSRTPRKSTGESVVEWLAARFREQREWRSSELKQMGTEYGFSPNALFKSPEVNALPIAKRPRTDGNGDRFWVWIAKPGWPESSESSESQNAKQGETKSSVLSEGSPDTRKSEINSTFGGGKSPENTNLIEPHGVASGLSGVSGLSGSGDEAETGAISFDTDLATSEKRWERRRFKIGTWLRNLLWGAPAPEAFVIKRAKDAGFSEGEVKEVARLVEVDTSGDNWVYRGF